MAEYLFNVTGANGRPIQGVRIAHGRINCPHDDTCAVAGCNDRPYRPGQSRVREAGDVHVRYTDSNGSATMNFGTCARDHFPGGFRYRYNGQPPTEVEAGSNGKVIFIRFGEAAAVLEGTWDLQGYQHNVPRSQWAARLELHGDGSFLWVETKGANPGARRIGTWRFDGKTFSMVYRAPGVGKVEWKSTTSVSDTVMSGLYRTPSAGPQPAGWGGSWSGSKAEGTTHIDADPEVHVCAAPCKTKDALCIRKTAGPGFCWQHTA